MFRRRSVSLGIFVGIVAIAGAMAQSGRIVRYDKFKERTLYSTGEELNRNKAYSTSGDDIGMHITAAYSCPGENLPCRPDTVLMTLVSYRDNFTYQDVTEFLVIADSVHINASVGKRTAEVDHLGFRVETMTVWLPLADFIKLANGSSVEAQLGPMEFSIGGDLLSDLRQFAIEIPSSSTVAPKP